MKNDLPVITNEYEANVVQVAMDHMIEHLTDDLEGEEPESPEYEDVKERLHWSICIKNRLKGMLL